jgi:hypothetical protein
MEDHGAQPRAEWLAQARRLSDASPPAHEANAWKAHATFVIILETRQASSGAEFQTKAHHMEADRTRAWAGIAGTEAAQWMAEQVDLAEKAPAAPSAVSPERLPVLELLAAHLPGYSDQLSKHLTKVRQVTERSQPAGAPPAASILPHPVRTPLPDSESAGLYSTTMELYLEKARRL